MINLPHHPLLLQIIGFCLFFSDLLLYAYVLSPTCLHILVICWCLFISLFSFVFPVFSERGREVHQCVICTTISKGHFIIHMKAAQSFLTKHCVLISFWLLIKTYYYVLFTFGQNHTHHAVGNCEYISDLEIIPIRVLELTLRFLMLQHLFIFLYNGHNGIENLIMYLNRQTKYIAVS